MTQINRTEYAQLQTLDQALIWAVVTLAEANRSPDNSDMLNYVTIRPEAVDYVNWKVQLDDDGQPLFTFSMLFPLVDHNPLESKPGLPLKIPTYTDFQPETEPLTLPVVGVGFPRPDIPPEITTLERLACWLGLIASQLGQFIEYCNVVQAEAINTLTAASLPLYTLDIRGLMFDRMIFQPVNVSTSADGGSTTSEGNSSSGNGSGNTPGNIFILQAPEYRGNPFPNNDYLNEKLNDARDEAASAEPPQTNPGQGYERIDTLPVCAEQDPKVKAYSQPLKELLK